MNKIKLVNFKISWLVIAMVPFLVHCSVYDATQRDEQKKISAKDHKTENTRAPIKNLNSVIAKLLVVTELVILDEVVGQDDPANEMQDFEIHFSSFIYDPYLPGGKGKKIESSKDRSKPMKINLATTTIIKGWKQGLVGLKKGGRRILIIPPELAYGKKGVKNVIPTDAPLLIEMEMQ